MRLLHKDTPVQSQSKDRGWNVRVHDVVGSRWIGVIYASTEEQARLAALSTFTIPSNVDFDVSPR